MGPCNVFIGQRYVIMGPCNVNSGPWNVNRGSGMLLWDRTMRLRDRGM